MPESFTTPDVPARLKHVHEAVWRFEEAFDTGDFPDLDGFLQDEGPERWGLLVELIHSDMELRWRKGQPVRLEEYRRRYPELAFFPNEVNALLEAEVRLRLRAGESPAPADYQQTFVGDDEGVSKAFRRAGQALPRVAGYEVSEELGRGGMGVVYRARQPRLNREVALKVIRLEAVDDASPGRFRREAEAVAAVAHPNVVRIYETWQADGEAALAMELLEGGSLQRRLEREGVLEPRDAASLLEKVARGVQAAHEKGIVHRDLKPDNVLFDAAGEPKVADFGLARRAGDGPALTQTGAVLGTPGYLSPEQAQGQSKEVGPASDVYGLGGILYSCLTGSAPFRGATAQELLLQVLNEEPVPPSRLRPGLPRDLETACLKCLAKRPADRYASARDVADDLRRFLAGEPVRARPAGPAEKAWKWARRRPDRAAALASLGLLVTATVVGLALFSTLQGRTNASLRALNTELETSRTSLAGRTRLAGLAVLSLAEKELKGKPDRAEQFLKLGRETLEPFSQERPEDHEVRAAMASALYHLGRIERGRGKPAEARAYWVRSVLASESLVRDAPQDSRFRSDLGQAYYNLAVLAKKSNKDAEQVEWLTKAIGVFRPTTKPGSPEAWFLCRAHWSRSWGGRRGSWAEALDDLAGALRYSDTRSEREGMVAEAGPALDNDLPATGALRLQAVGAYAVAAAAARADAKQPLARREQEASRWAGRGVALLKKAKQEGLLNNPALIEQIRTVPELAPVREHADFKPVWPGLF